MTSEVTEPSATRTEDAPVDVEVITRAVEDALGMELSTSTRDQIDAATDQMIGHMSLLLSEDLGAEADDEVMALFRASYWLLDMSKRPTDMTPAYEAFSYMRNASMRTRSLLRAYMRRNGVTLP